MRRNLAVILLACAVLLAVAITVGVGAGSVSLSPGTVGRSSGSTSAAGEPDRPE